VLAIVLAAPASAQSVPADLLLKPSIDSWPTTTVTTAASTTVGSHRSRRQTFIK
jgi:hypothetical protein